MFIRFRSHDQKDHEPKYGKTLPYTTFTNFSMEYHLMCKVYTDVGGIK